MAEVLADVLPDNGARLVDQEYRCGCQTISEQVEDLVAFRHRRVPARVKQGELEPELFDQGFRAVKIVRADGQDLCVKGSE